MLPEVTDETERRGENQNLIDVIVRSYYQQSNHLVHIISRLARMS